MVNSSHGPLAEIRPGFEEEDHEIRHPVLVRDRNVLANGLVHEAEGRCPQVMTRPLGGAEVASQSGDGSLSISKLSDNGDSQRGSVNLGR